MAAGNGLTNPPQPERTERGVDLVPRLEGVDGDIDSLTDSKEDAINSLGVYGDEVGRDDTVFMFVVHNGDSEVVLLRGVDKAKTITLSWGQGYAGI
jgi:hypothetical protein